MAQAVSELDRKMGFLKYTSDGLKEALKSQRETIARVSDATLTLAGTDKILDEVQRRLKDGALEAEFALKKEAEALKKVKEEAKRLDGTKARVKVEVDRSAWGKIGRFFSGDGGTGGSGWLSRGPFNTGGASGAAALFSNPYILGGAAAAGTLALPVAAQGLAGAGILGLGAGLAGLGIYGALSATGPQGQLQLTAATDRLKAAELKLAALQANPKSTQASILSAQATVASSQATYNQLSNNFQQATAAQVKMKAAFQNLSNDAQSALAQIGKAFVPVMTSIFNTADSVLKKLTPVFAGAERVIAGPFRKFADTLINALAQPAVKASIDAVAGAFGKLLGALTPQLGGDIAQIADGISRIARSVADHPQAFADLVSGIFKIAGVTLDAVSALANFGGYLQQHFWPAMHRTSVIFDGFRHETAHIWDDLSSDMIRTWRATWNDTIGVLIRFEGHAFAIFADFRHRTAVVFDGARHDFSHIWDLIGQDTIGKVVQFLGTTVNWFKGLPGRITGVLGNAEVVLDKWGRGVIDGLWSGAKSVWNSVVNFFKSLPGTILHALGIKSPPDWAIQAGVHIVEGIGIGMARAKDKVAAATAALKSGTLGGLQNPGGPAAGSPAQAQQMAMKMAALVGWTGSLWTALNNLVMRESGWSMTATNPTSGAYGIAQGITGPSWYYQWPGGNPNTLFGQLTGLFDYIACVPLDTRILTREGWKSHDEVREGDETVGYDPLTGKSAWTKVTAVYSYAAAPVTRLYSNRVSLRSTPNHRWVTEKNIQGRTSGTYRREDFTETQHIGTRHRIRLAAPHDDPEGLFLSTAEAELLGWIVGDGCVSYSLNNRGGKRGKLNLSIAQSKPEGTARIRELIADLPHSEYHRPLPAPVRRRDGKMIHARRPVIQWRLRAPYARDLLRRSGYESGLESMVIAMSSDQREAFIAGLLLGADGYRDKSDSWTFCQNEGPELRAFILAAYLSGYRCKPFSSAGQTHVRLCPPYAGSGSGFHREDLGIQPVWCVTTELGTWTAEQDGQVFLTGNSRYGNPGAAWAHELNMGWYDRGGYLPPGLSLALNTTGRPEPVGGAGTTYNIYVHVPPTVNPKEAGRQVADLLGAHLKGGGRLYPAGMAPR